MNGLIFILFILLFLAVLFAAAPSARLTTPRVARTVGPRLHPAARAAMRQAGYEADDSYVQVADIGLLAYRNTDEGRVVRQGDVLLDTRYLRPFAKVWLPYAAVGNVRFELADGDGRLRYADEATYELKRGENTVLPGTWLPLQGLRIEPDDEWALRLSASDTLLASHRFGWRPVGGGRIQRYVAGDGELSPVLQEAMMREAVEAITLEELLAEQEE